MKTVIAALATVATVLVPSLADAQKLVFVVRHAERADGGAATGQMTSPPDPLLSKAGEERAARLAAMLADAGIQAILTTEFRRTIDTAKPLAAKLGLSVQSISSKDAAGLMNRLKSQHANDVVLVVGHSNTVPEIIRQLGGPAVKIADNEYDNLFVVVPATGAMTRIRF